MKEWRVLWSRCDWEGRWGKRHICCYYCDGIVNENEAPSHQWSTSNKELPTLVCYGRKRTTVGCLRADVITFIFLARDVYNRKEHHHNYEWPRRGKACNWWDLTCSCQQWCAVSAKIDNDGGDGTRWEEVRLGSLHCLASLSECVNPWNPGKRETFRGHRCKTCNVVLEYA